MKCCQGWRGWLLLPMLLQLSLADARYRLGPRHKSESAFRELSRSSHIRRPTFQFTGRTASKPHRGSSLLQIQSRDACTVPKELKFRSFQANSLVDLLANHKPFTFLRFGDGDWYCSLGSTGMDSNGIYLENETAMCKELARDIRSLGADGRDNLFPVLGTFFLCSQTSPDMFEHVEDFLLANPMPARFSGFLDSYAAGFYFPLLPPKKPGRSRGVVPMLQGQTVVLVGPRHLGTLQDMLNYTSHIEVPLHGCWESRDTISSSIKQKSLQHPDQTVVFLVAGGIAGRTLMFQMFSVLGQKDTFIDIGSSLDGFAGVASRDYNQNIKCTCEDYPEYVASDVCDDIDDRLSYDYEIPENGEDITGDENVDRKDECPSTGLSAQGTPSKKEGSAPAVVPSVAKKLGSRPGGVPSMDDEAKKLANQIADEVESEVDGSRKPTISPAKPDQSSSKVMPAKFLRASVPSSGNEKTPSAGSTDDDDADDDDEDENSMSSAAASPSNGVNHAVSHEVLAPSKGAKDAFARKVMGSGSIRMVCQYLLPITTLLIMRP